MAKTKEIKSSIRGTSKKSMIPLHDKKEFSWTKEGIRTDRKSKIGFATERALVIKVRDFGYPNLKRFTPYLLLSAKTPYVDGKGYFNAINCQSIFPESPSVQFPWWSQQYPSLPTAGKIEIWLTDLQEHQNLTVEIRLSGFSYNGSSAYEVRSSIAPGLYGYFPIQIDSKIDLFFPDIDLDGMNSGLITIEANDMDGSWTFYDAKINIVE